MNPHDFKAKWWTESGNERQTYQEHFGDLCALLHQPTPSAADRAIWSAYGWPDNPMATTGEQILEGLLALNLARGH